MNNIIKFFKFLFYRYKFKRKSITINSINASFKADYGSYVSIGRNTLIGKDVVIDDYTYVNSNSYIENCVIGKFCSISSGVYICPTEHKLDYITTHPITKYDINRKPVIIGHDVLICLNAIILEGVTIGDGAVIGAGAIVTKDVRPYEIVAGVPAKHIRWRFSEEKVKYLQDLKWWDWKFERIQSNIPFFKNECDRYT